MLAVAACGGGGDDEAETTTTRAQVDRTTTSAKPVASDSVDVDEEAWFGGFKLTFVRATLTPDDFGAGSLVEIETEFENEGDADASLNAEMNLASGGENYEVDTSDVPNVPGKAKGTGSLKFRVEETFTFEDAVLTLGSADLNQAVVPIGDEGELVTLEPRTITAAGSGQSGTLKVDLRSGELRYDVLRDHAQVEKGKVSLSLTFDATFLGDFAGGFPFVPENLALMIPRGATVAPDESPIELLQPQSSITDQVARFTIDDPPEGTYQLVVRNVADAPPANIEFEIT
jgi:hypothetical protein